MMDDPFILNYQASELGIAAEFLKTWLPFLSRDLCLNCAQTLSDRIRSLDPDPSADCESNCVENFVNLNINDCESHENVENCNSNSLGSCKDGADCDTHSLRSWKDGPNDCSESPTTSNAVEAAARDPAPVARMSWADMAQEDELEVEGEEAGDAGLQLGVGECEAEEAKGNSSRAQKKSQELSRDQREYIRFMNVGRKKDFIYLERFEGKIVNILDGLELHTGVFSAAEQKRIVDHVYSLQDMGRKGLLKERTYSEPRKWMRGKGRVTIQFGCCYNYATDKNGNPPGILRSKLVDPIPHLFKVIIRRLVGWHVLPPTCVPDSCIVNIYEEGDCIPPHIDNHDFVRPFCTVSFLSECNILFGSKLKIVAAGEFFGAIAIPLPVGSVLVLSGNGADVAKHCVPAVPTKRISITFRKMDEKKLPFNHVPEADLQGLKPLSYGSNKSKRLQPSKVQPNNGNRRGMVVDRENVSLGRVAYSEQNLPARARSHPGNKQRRQA